MEPKSTFKKKPIFKASIFRSKMTAEHRDNFFKLKKRRDKRLAQQTVNKLFSQLLFFLDFYFSFERTMTFRRHRNSRIRCSEFIQSF